MTEANYTPEDLAKCEQYMRDMLSLHFGGVFEYDKNEQIKYEEMTLFALALAQKVLGEPSEECERLGCEELLKWPWLKEMMGNVELPPEPLLAAHKAMIQQAVKEVR